MIRGKAKFRRSRIAGIVWFAVLTASLLLYWWVMANFVIRDFWDPSFVMKSERLRARIKEDPQRPLWLVLGSSRVEFGLRPGVVEEGGGNRDVPLIFNFGMSGAGVFRQYIYLHRLLEEGIKPRGVGIEIFAADMNRELIPASDVPQLLVRARKDELGDYLRYSNTPPDFLAQWWRSRLDPAYKYGMRMPGQTLTWRLVPLPVIRRVEKKMYDPWGWIPVPATTPEDVYRKNFDVTKGRYKGDLQNLTISTNADLVIRKILVMCKTAGIEVFLLKMPESADFREMYTPQASVTLASYIAKIQADYPAVPLIDASTWIATAGFSDGHHLNGTGGGEFTRRLAAELFKIGKAQAGP